MARDRHGRLAGGETAAFEKLSTALRHCAEAADGLAQRLSNADMHRLTKGLRQCIEGSTEISVFRSDPRWFALTPVFEKMLQNANALHLAAMRAGGSGVPADRWKRMALTYRKTERAVASLWGDAERGAVQGRVLQ